MEIKITRTADTILMVRPKDFGYNKETGVDNEFQNKPDMTPELINKKANEEFQAMADGLRGKGVIVLILEPPISQDVTTPDAIFPNNWFSTEHDGTILTYPMMAKNRKAERRLMEIENLLNKNRYTIRNCINVGRLDETKRFLEGTGSLIIDPVDEVVYAARSERCDPDQFDNFIRLRFYLEGILFDTKSSSGNPIYHTNVMMSLGEKYAVICLECIPDKKQKNHVLATLNKSFNVMEITMDQMENHFCGNILEVRNQKNDSFIVMSENARQGFTKDQKNFLEQYGKILSFDLSIIEKIGGGSARCMMAEIFSVREKEFS
ncbi:citrulline utilization hydrolase CtlX [Desulfobacula sp.]|uniref:citrulline utilization hydrolase CtlX n=1 Tax=Desulfobacula sp. TaxID=2593537 RepID=UPI0026211E79|nr:arginine deiminase-related protein [Desulfobacula sp.]